MDWAEHGMGVGWAWALLRMFLAGYELCCGWAGLGMGLSLHGQGCEWLGQDMTRHGLRWVWAWHWGMCTSFWAEHELSWAGAVLCKSRASHCLAWTRSRLGTGCAGLGINCADPRAWHLYELVIGPAYACARVGHVHGLHMFTGWA
jgi:hypothetical protein